MIAKGKIGWEDASSNKRAPVLLAAQWHTHLRVPRWDEHDGENATVRGAEWLAQYN